MIKEIEDLDSTKAKEILEVLLSKLGEYRPFPWAYDHDWTAEIVDANNRTIIKTDTPEQAKEIAALANSFIVKPKRKKEFEQLEQDDLEHQQEFGERAK